MVYIVTYDLNKPFKAYDSLYSSLKAYSYAKDPGLDSVWFIETQLTPEQIFNSLAGSIDKNDRVFISRIRLDENYGWLSPEVWNWLEPRI